ALAPHVWAALHDVGVQPRLGGIAVQTRGRAVLGVSPLNLVRQRVVPAAPIYGDRLRAIRVLYRERNPSQGHNNGGRADRQRSPRADGHRRPPSGTHLTAFHITLPARKPLTPHARGRSSTPCQRAVQGKAF